MQTLVKDVMNADPVAVASDISLTQAAQHMQMLNCGVLPVGTNDKLEGIITDRDIVLRAVAKGQDMSKEKVSNYMTREVFFCKDSDTLEQAAEIMHEHHVNRLVVRDSRDKMCGILSFGCILRKNTSMGDIHQVLEKTVGKKAA